MALLDTSRTVARPALSGVFSRIAELFTAWNELRVTRNELAKLSDRELADIGLTRYEAETIGR